MFGRRTAACERRRSSDPSTNGQASFSPHPQGISSHAH